MAFISNGTTILDAGSFSTSLGSMVHIKTLTADGSGSNLTFVHGSSSVVFDSTYPVYLFKFIGIHPSNNGVKFTFQVSINGGSGYGVNTTCTYWGHYHNEAGTAASVGYEAASDVSNATSEIQLIREDKLSGDNDHCGTGELYFFSPSNTTFAKNYLARTQANHEAEYTMDSFIGGYIDTTSAVNAIRFSVSAGNMDGGVIKMYGIKDS